LAHIRPFGIVEQVKSAMQDEHPLEDLAKDAVAVVAADAAASAVEHAVVAAAVAMAVAAAAAAAAKVLVALA
jgi:hypothetical protein